MSSDLATLLKDAVQAAMAPVRAPPRVALPRIVRGAYPPADLLHGASLARLTRAFVAFDNARGNDTRPSEAATRIALTVRFRALAADDDVLGTRVDETLRTRPALIDADESGCSSADFVGLVASLCRLHTGTIGMQLTHAEFADMSAVDLVSAWQLLAKLNNKFPVASAIKLFSYIATDDPELRTQFAACTTLAALRTAAYGAPPALLRAHPGAPQQLLPASTSAPPTSSTSASASSSSSAPPPARIAAVAATPPPAAPRAGGSRSSHRAPDTPACLAGCATRHYMRDCPAVLAYRAARGLQPPAPATRRHAGCAVCDGAHRVTDCNVGWATVAAALRVKPAQVYLGTLGARARAAPPPPPLLLLSPPLAPPSAPSPLLTLAPPRPSLYAPPPPPSSSSSSTHRLSLWLHARIGACDVAATIDTGASHNVIDDVVARRAGLVVRACTSPATARVPGDGVISFSGITSARLDVGDISLDMPELLVMRELGHDIIVGVPTLFPLPGTVGARSLRFVDAPPDITLGAGDVAVRFGDSAVVVAHSTLPPTHAPTSPPLSPSPPSPPPPPPPSSSSSPSFVCIAATRPDPDVIDACDDVLLARVLVGGQPYTLEVYGNALVNDVDVLGAPTASVATLAIPPARAALEPLLAGSCTLAAADAQLAALSSAINNGPVVSTLAPIIVALDTPEPIAIGETAPPPPPPPAGSSMSASMLPDCLDAHISPGVSEQLVRDTALRLRRRAHLFGGSRRPRTLQAPPPCNAEAFEIRLRPDVDCGDIYAGRRTYAPQTFAAIKKQVELWRATGVVIACKSPFSSALLGVAKKDGSIRVCVDYRDVNALSLMDRFPAATVPDCLAALACARRTITADLWIAFNQFKVNDALTRELLAFPFDGELFTFTVAPFGPKGVPAHVDRFLHNVFAGSNWVQYADDVSGIIRDDTPLACLERLDDMLERADTASTTFSGKKLQLFYARTFTLGKCVADGGVYPPPNVMHALVNTPTPTTRAELRQLVHAVGAWRSHLPGLSGVLAPLHRAAAPRSGPFELGRVEHAALAQLRELLKSPLITAPYDPSRRIILRTDFSQAALAWVIYQRDDQGLERVVRIGGRLLSPGEQSAPAAQGEILAVRDAIRLNIDILGASQFPLEWMSDNKPAIDALSGPLSRNAVIARTQAEMQTVPYVATHVSGKSAGHALVDFLSRQARGPPPAPAMAAHARDVGATPNTPSRLIERLAALLEFRSLADAQLSVVEWLSSQPATPAALRVWPTSLAHDMRAAAVIAPRIAPLVASPSDHDDDDDAASPSPAISDDDTEDDSTRVNAAAAVLRGGRHLPDRPDGDRRRECLYGGRPVLAGSAGRTVLGDRAHRAGPQRVPVGEHGAARCGVWRAAGLVDRVKAPVVDDPSRGHLALQRAGPIRRRRIGIRVPGDDRPERGAHAVGAAALRLESRRFGLAVWRAGIGVGVQLLSDPADGHRLPARPGGAAGAVARGGDEPSGRRRGSTGGRSPSRC